jgi:hypothetical protein
MTTIALHSKISNLQTWVVVEQVSCIVTPIVTQCFKPISRVLVDV